jgi:hypothetical protein
VGQDAGAEVEELGELGVARAEEDDVRHCNGRLCIMEDGGCGVL